MRREHATAVLLLLAVGAIGCGDRPAESAPSGQASTYQVRGVVRSLGEGSLHIRHEAIPGFRDPSGDVVGMQAMSMDFALETGIAIEGLVAGDKVAFELTVDWDAQQPARITSLEVLPADAELTF